MTMLEEKQSNKPRAGEERCPNSFAGKSLLSMRDLAKEEILSLLDKTRQIKKQPFEKCLQGKILASCFFEPSTRTRLSFEAAMKKCGGNVIGFAEGSSTSSSKKESLYDTMKILGQYTDVLVLRHPLEGAARCAADATGKPVINAGDGANQHPTQTLIDLYSIRESQGRLDNLNIGFAGDLRGARTVHSLVQACVLFNMRVYFVPFHGLVPSPQTYEDLKRQGVLFSIHRSLQEVLPKLDILYMTRVQEERLGKETVYTPSNGYDLTLSLLKSAKSTMKVLHPLPRIREIDPQIDATPHAYYFNQAENGLFVRAALLQLILGGCLP